MRILADENNRRRLRLLIAFLMGQGAVQFLNQLSGFLLVRWLSLASYAQYGLVFGFQSTLNILIDVGISTTVVALVGTRYHDAEVIGGYVRAGRYLRLRLMAVILPVACIIFLLAARRQTWSLWSDIAFLISITLTVHFSGLASYYGSPLVIQRDLRSYYGNQSVAAVARLLLICAAELMRILNGVYAALANSCGFVITALRNRDLALQRIVEPLKADPAVVREMLHYAAPNIPGIIFFALQGQISLYLISFFGKGSAGIAQVAALTRLVQIFVLLSSFNNVVLEGWFARVGQWQANRRFVIALAGALMIVTGLMLFTRAEPHVVLWLIGKRYANLTTEVVWAILNGCLGYLVGLCWTFISARRFIYWGSTMINILLIITVQIAWIALFGVATPLRALQFSCAAAAVSLLAQVLNIFYGLYRGPRLMSDSHL